MDPKDQRGIALIVVLMALVLFTGLGVALALNTSIEGMIANNFRQTQEVFYAADAGVERAIADLSTTPQWNAILNGSVRSSFVDGAPGGTRTLADGSTIDLTELQNRLNCRKPTACSPGDMDAVTSTRPWGTNNPRWQLYAYGSLGDLSPSGRIASPHYVVVMIADDSSETDDDPLSDGADPDNPGQGVLALHVEAYGPRGAKKTIEAIVASGRISQSGTASVRTVSWNARR